MNIVFYKYQGTGNDFIILDNREGKYNSLTKEQIARLCHRRFGIGADGLMLLQLKKGYDFEMIYYNADGGESSMCGNGGRCLVSFANKLGIIKTKAHFIAIDGEHEAELLTGGSVKLKMQDVSAIERGKDYTLLNTGSPHCVVFKPGIKELDVYTEGKKIRYSNRFAEKGVNVNFVESEPGNLFVRTYERGVENETLSCGTGVTAAAIAASKDDIKIECLTNVSTPGGNLNVQFDKLDDYTFRNVYLIGPANLVFEGTISI
ncbi:MAG TPA: diaminopimelate epimerase [Chitinophagaceae bacterium]|nr:diaminopimelate epimerase [Chitinophagaceae bacterium]